MNRIIIDVREPFEFLMGHVKGALNIPPSQLMAGSDKLQSIPKDAELILYCRSGSRSAAASHIFKSMGYKNITNGINKDQVKEKYGIK
jgi:rhodanese-related sulfurtransferase